MNEPAAVPLIACVDDEENIRTTLAYALEKNGYRVETYADGWEAWEKFRRQLPDMAIIDIMMPRMDGLELCRHIRRISEDVPLIILTSRDEEIDRVVGLELGADDYLCKPYSMRELLARIKVIFRRTNPVPAAAGGPADPSGFPGSGIGSTSAVAVGDLLMDLDRYVVTWKKCAVPLTVTEFRILQVLASAPGQPRSREQLLRAAYPEDLYVSDRSADSHIKRIRKKFTEVDSRFSMIDSIYGLGYRYKA